MSAEETIKEDPRAAARRRIEAALKDEENRLALRSHALYCASMVYNGLLSRPTPIHLEGPRITALADHFAEWLADPDHGGEAAREAPQKNLGGTSNV